MIQFYHAFRSICPRSWTERWDGQRGMSKIIIQILSTAQSINKMVSTEGGNFPVRLDR